MNNFLIVVFKLIVLSVSVFIFYSALGYLKKSLKGYGLKAMAISLTQVPAFWKNPSKATVMERIGLWVATMALFLLSISCVYILLVN